jgi:F0F1-type ATP synthase membrane subunit c/vacuolar-type H+-ATPase subunit K
MNELEVAQLALQGSKAIGAGVAMAGAIGAGIGLGIYLGNYVGALARNPGAKGELGKVLWVGIGLIEAIAIFALAVALINLFV